MKTNKILALVVKDLLPWGIDQVTGIVSAHLKQKGRKLITEQIESQEQLIKKIAKKTGKSTSIMTRNVEDIGLSKDEVGRRTWDKIHNSAAALPEDVTESQIKETMNTIKKIIKEYPCADCNENGKRNLKIIADRGFSIDSVKTRTDAVKWCFDYHNIVNEDIEKDQFSIEDLKEKYDF